MEEPNEEPSEEQKQATKELEGIAKINETRRIDRKGKMYSMKRFNFGWKGKDLFLNDSEGRPIKLHQTASGDIYEYDGTGPKQNTLKRVTPERFKELLEISKMKTA